MSLAVKLLFSMTAMCGLASPSIPHYQCVCVCFVFSVNVAIVTDCLGPVCEAFMLISTDQSHWEHREVNINAVD